MVISPPQPAILRSSALRSVRSQPAALVDLDSNLVAIPGKVTFRTHRGEPASAVLGADGVWRCPELPVLDRVLNTLFRPGETVRRNDPALGRAELARVAGWIKGQIETVASRD